MSIPGVGCTLPQAARRERCYIAGLLAFSPRGKDEGTVLCLDSKEDKEQVYVFSIKTQNRPLSFLLFSLVFSSLLFGALSAILK